MHDKIEDRGVEQETDDKKSLPQLNLYYTSNVVPAVNIYLRIRLLFIGFFVSHTSASAYIILYFHQLAGMQSLILDELQLLH